MSLLIVSYKKCSRRKGERNKTVVWKNTSSFKVLFVKPVTQLMFPFLLITCLKRHCFSKWCIFMFDVILWSYFSEGDTLNPSCNICWHSQICCLSALLAFKGHEVHLYPNLFWNWVPQLSSGVVRKAPYFLSSWCCCSEYTWRETAKTAR